MEFVLLQDPHVTHTGSYFVVNDRKKLTLGFKFGTKKTTSPTTLLKS